MTYGLILANCAMFAVETYRGGSQDLQTLFDLGGLWPESVLRGGVISLLASFVVLAATCILIARI